MVTRIDGAKNFDNHIQQIAIAVVVGGAVNDDKNGNGAHRCGETGAQQLVHLGLGWRRCAVQA